MSDETPPVTPAGWHRDPYGQPGQRYWDGKAWTDHFHPDGPQTNMPMAATSNIQKEDPANNSLATWGWVTAVLFPIIGAAIGFVLTTRQDQRGGKILILSAVMFVIALILIGVGAASESETGSGAYNY